MPVCAWGPVCCAGFMGPFKQQVMEPLVQLAVSVRDMRIGIIDAHDEQHRLADHADPQLLLRKYVGIGVRASVPAADPTTPCDTT